MTQYLQEPLNSPSVWRGRDLAGRDDWILHLERNHVEELEAALAAVEERGLEPLQITAQDFPLPTLSPLCQEIRSELEGGRGFVVLRSLPLQRLSEEGIARMFWGLGTHLGTAEPQDGAGNLLHHVRDTGMDLNKHDVRAYQTNRAINYHNDGADVFLLLCVQAAQRGGRTRLVSSAAVFNEILGRRADLARVLQEPFCFDTRGQQAPGRPPYQQVPIFNFHAGYLNVLYKREYIDLALRFPQVPALTPQQTEALDLLDEVCDELALEFEVQSGDILVVNNYDLLHARSAYQDEGPAAQKRHMLRLWVSIPNGRLLPPIFATTREFCHSFARRQGP
jgi:hypothetical protein